ncbi:hypothetical protein [Massilia yuzhufengensis]|uniref:Uncharacterized protein n=1 Tax=Massilia yuzhufengensis TaxID=1164594 RepID=A0A1I1EA67_9BURK|nr:hypothetical protein [Massilia yuzhufengensis]SFB84014.1 hypothetical protein SAMN05216204_10251 [Massilia yuzhufengensis]
MRRLSSITLATLLLCGAAGAAEKEAVRELDPVHVNAMRNPEVRKYKVIVAGLDAFERDRKLAPAAERLLFRVTTRKKDESPEPLAVRLAGDDGFKLPLAIDASGRFTVPRSEAALDAASELELNRKKGVYRTEPEIRTPGLPDNQRRLGDLRLECKVTIAMAKAEIPTFWVLTINTFLMRTDWCGFFGDPDDTRFEGASRHAHFGYRTDRPLARALLVDGNRSALLKVEGRSFNVPIGNHTWSDDAVVELTWAEAATGTAGETPRTAP